MTLNRGAMGLAVPISISTNPTYWSCLLGIATVATTTAMLYLRDRTSGVVLGDQNIITRDVVKEKSKGWQEEKARRESRMEKMRKRD